MEDESLIAEILHLRNHFYDSEVDKKYHKLNSRINKNDAIIREALENDENLLSHYTTVFETLEEYESLNNEDHFINGFKYGFKLALEIFDINL